MTEPRELINWYHLFYKLATGRRPPLIDYRMGWFRFRVKIKRQLTGEIMTYTKKAMHQKEFKAEIEELKRQLSAGNL